ncbi:MAG: malectin domain-containing carbohydrate-binding protein [Terracidiphilus sp.]
MSLEVVAMARSKEAPVAGEREELVRRVASSVTFEKSPRLRAFLLHVCRCALHDRAEEATEQQIGIYVYERPSTYNPNDDNIVRSQARMLRMKLEHHFANEGRDEPVIITIPKGQYLPAFENRLSEPPKPLVELEPIVRKTRWPRWVLAGSGILMGLLLMWFGLLALKTRQKNQPNIVARASIGLTAAQPDSRRQTKSQQVAAAADAGDVRIAAGHTGAPYVDAWGHRWEADRYYEGGVVQAGPKHLFPPVVDEGLFKSIRQAVSSDEWVPQSEQEFHYNIPLAPGVYELRLYFADPLREQPTITPDGAGDDEENKRHFDVIANGHPILSDFDPIADAGASAVDERVFTDVRPAADGKLHLDFRTDWGQPAFVSGIELTPGMPGKLKPIRVSALRSDYLDANGIRWSGDNYFIFGRTHFYEDPKAGSDVPAFYTGERHGNFSYSIPVAPGSYTLRLYFMESFFSPAIRLAHCHGAGCRVFDVTCNGVSLLQDFDIFQVAGAFHPVIREFHGLHPNGQGKLLISFSPKVNYAEVRAIEVLDEAK